jgi:imidazolonepropionase-like amidohydrolase
MTEIAPTGGLISGQSSLVKTTAWNWEDAAIKTDKGLHLNWPSKINHRGWWAEPEAPEASKNVGKIEELKALFTKAKLSFGTKSETDQKTKALWPLFTGQRTLMVHANSASDIVDAVLFFKSFEITPVIVGGGEAWTITSFLKEHNVAVVIVRTHSLPTYNHTDIDIPYRLPAILSDSGVAFAITDQEHWQQRNLAFQAGTAIAYGLSANEALKSITLYPAKIMGVADLYGSLEVGKTCTIIVSEGDLFDMRTSIINTAYFNGIELDLNDKQKDLYKLYSERYFGND